MEHFFHLAKKIIAKLSPSWQVQFELGLRLALISVITIGYYFVLLGTILYYWVFLSTIVYYLGTIGYCKAQFSLDSGFYDPPTPRESSDYA